MKPPWLFSWPPTDTICITILDRKFRRPIIQTLFCVNRVAASVHLEYCNILLACKLVLQLLHDNIVVSYCAIAGWLLHACCGSRYCTIIL